MPLLRAFLLIRSLLFRFLTNGLDGHFAFAFFAFSLLSLCTAGRPSRRPRPHPDYRRDASGNVKCASPGDNHRPRRFCTTIPQPNSSSCSLNAKPTSVSSSATFDNLKPGSSFHRDGLRHCHRDCHPVSDDSNSLGPTDDDNGDGNGVAQHQRQHHMEPDSVVCAGADDRPFVL